MQNPGITFEIKIQHQRQLWLCSVTITQLPLQTVQQEGNPALKEICIWDTTHFIEKRVFSKRYIPVRAKTFI